MHVLIVVDDDAARREAALVARLAVALAGDGARVTCAMPASAAIEDRSSDSFALAARIVAYRDRGLPFTEGWRARELARAATDEGAGEPIVDVVHAIGERSWGIAAEVARATGALLAIDVFGADQAGMAVRQALRHTDSILLAADRHVHETIEAMGTGLAMHLAPWGVHTPEGDGGPGHARKSHVGGADHVSSVVISGPCRSATAAVALLEGVREASRERESALFFADLPTARAAGFYRQVQRLGLSQRLTVIPDAELHRHVVLHADAFVLPESPRQHRTLVLEVLAAGLPVLTPVHDDRRTGFSYLIPGVTCRGVTAMTAEAWRAALVETLSDGALARRLGAAGREHVRTHHSVARHAASVLAAYEAAVGQEAIPLNMGHAPTQETEAGL